MVAAVSEGSPVYWAYLASLHVLLEVLCECDCHPLLRLDGQDSHPLLDMLKPEANLVLVEGDCDLSCPLVDILRVMTFLRVKWHG